MFAKFDLMEIKVVANEDVVVSIPYVLNVSNERISGRHFGGN